MSATPLLHRLFFLVVLSGCAVKAPTTTEVYDRPIYTLDNRDSTNVVLRYREDEDVIKVQDPKAKGMLCFLPEDFEAFLAIYFMQDLENQSKSSSGGK